MRITTKHLEEDVQILNKISHGKYFIDGAYGKVRLCNYVNNKDTRDGILSVTGYVSKSTLHEIIHGILEYIKIEAINEIPEI